MPEMNRVEKIISYIIVSLSMIIGSFGGFWIYIKKYLKADDKVRTELEKLLSEMSVIKEKQMIVLFFVSCIGMLVIWVVGFAMYKIIFKVAKTAVNDVEVVIAIGTAYTVSFFTGSFLVGKMVLALVVLIVNLIEICIVYFGLLDKIKANIGKCILIRGIILILNIVLAVIGIR